MKLFKHSFYNLLGLGLPLLAAIFTIPILITTLGEARFGLLTLIWAVVSYFGLFDLGLGRALTRELAKLLAKNELSCIGPLVATATGIMAALGLVAALVMALFAPYLVDLINAIPERQEVIRAMYSMAFCMPFIVLTSGFRGILEASQAFGVINAIRLPMGLFTFIGPLLVVIYWQPRLDLIAFVLSAGRVVACAAHYYAARQILPKNHGLLKWNTHLLKPLCVSGGWLTVSNLISPFMGYVDRFIIATIVSASAVAYYATPNELVTKLWIVPGALTAVLFPAFASQISQRDPNTWLVFKKALHWLFAALFPIALALGMFSRELLSLWINPEFSAQSAHLLQIFAFGILINCMAHVPFTLIQGAGSAKLTAIIHSAELPFFLVALWWLTSIYGVTGAAIAWLLRVTVDTFLMFGVSAPLVGRTICSIAQPKALMLGAIAMVGFSGVLIIEVQIRIIWMTVFAAVVVATLFIPKSSS